VLVTPHIVAPLNPDQVPALPGEHWRHPKDGELFWFKDIGGEKVDFDAKAKPAAKQPSKETSMDAPAPAENAQASAPARTGDEPEAPEAPARFGGDFGFAPSGQQAPAAASE
jgi:Flp pilus assembly secretin CpaC